MNRATFAVPLALGAALCAAAAPAGEEATQLREAPGRDVVAARCVACHSLDYIEMNAPALDRAGWDRSVRKMIDQFGAPVSSEDAQRIVAYLADNY
jgi:sulfite dehydrogenase (cytochrome) subunit B